MTYALTLRQIEAVTPDVHRLVFDKPEGFDFEPGQAVDLALDKDGWRDEKRPFTFTSLPVDTELEFTIKSYPEHDGVTEQIGQMKPGDKVLIDAPWGAISDEGPGYFIAGGAGVTPFIAILRKRLTDKGTLEGCTLIFSNETEEDIILRQEFEQMPGLRTLFTVTDDDKANGVLHRMIDKDFLSRVIEPEHGHYYICGPDKMIEAISDALKELGVDEKRIVTEDFD
ncbi:FAD-binding oxidoreductase [Mesobacterium pallidum]|uniref:FAD-binding oxidoreductase n=1 Tax=Mesobacterium pallidum TaxID=2872037 RepID=UPI001EE30BCE|nr:FAD-binding oxidoreductase [Mesobacterium pallidum]